MDMSMSGPKSPLQPLAPSWFTGRATFSHWENIPIDKNHTQPHAPYFSSKSNREATR